MNAHINHDLALALIKTDIGAEPQPALQSQNMTITSALTASWPKCSRRLLLSWQRGFWARRRKTPGKSANSWRFGMSALRGMVRGILLITCELSPQPHNR